MNPYPSNSNFFDHFKHAVLESQRFSISKAGLLLFLCPLTVHNTQF